MSKWPAKHSGHSPLKTKPIPSDPMIRRPN